MDRFGRKKVIMIKAFMILTALIPLMIIGFTKTANSQNLLPIYFISLFFATFTFDLSLLGYETLPRKLRENHFIIL